MKLLSHLQQLHSEVEHGADQKILHCQNIEHQVWHAVNVLSMLEYVQALEYKTTGCYGYLHKGYSSLRLPSLL